MNIFLITVLMYVVTLLPFNLEAHDTQEIKSIISDKSDKTKKFITTILIGSILVSLGVNIKLYLNNRMLSALNKNLNKDKESLKTKAQALEVELNDKTEKIKKHVTDYTNSRDLLKKMGSFLLKIRNFRITQEELVQSFIKMKEELILATPALQEDNSIVYEKTKQNMEEVENKLKELKAQLNLSEWIPINIYEENPKKEAELD